MEPSPHRHSGSLGPPHATVDPEGLDTVYHFEYVDEVAFTAGGFSAAASTPSVAAGSGSSPFPARAAVSGLVPDTTYRYRLVASSSDPSSPAFGVPGSFTTTAGFGFLPGTTGFDAALVTDGGAAATQAGSHPYELNLDLGFNQGGEFEGQPGAPFADGDLRDLRVDLPQGLLLNPKALDKCRLDDFHRPRSSPFEASLSGESCPDRSQVGTIELRSSSGGGLTRRFGLFNVDPPPGVAAQLGAAPFGSPVTFDVEIHANPDNSYSLSLAATDFPQALDAYGLSLALWGVPWNQSHDAQRGNCLNEVDADFPWAKCSIGDPFRAPATRHSPISLCRPTARALSPSPPMLTHGSSQTRSRSAPSTATRLAPRLTRRVARASPSHRPAADFSPMPRPPRPPVSTSASKATARRSRSQASSTHLNPAGRSLPCPRV